VYCVGFINYSAQELFFFILLFVCWCNKVPDEGIKSEKEIISTFEQTPNKLAEAFRKEKNWTEGSTCQAIGK
jgi:hypothetical protein